MGEEKISDETFGPNNVAMCDEFFGDISKANWFKSSLKFIIIIGNYIIKTCVIYAVKWIGYETLTKQLERVTVVTFLCLFFNTGFIMMLVNADLTE
jgi:hypothetical protein